MNPANFADGILEAAGGCIQLRRSVFQFLDRFEALRLADVSPHWRDVASHPSAWLPQYIGYQYTQSTRSATINAGVDGSSSSPTTAQQRGGGGGAADGGSSSGGSFGQNPLLIPGTANRRTRSPTHKSRSPTNRKQSPSSTPVRGGGGHILPNLPSSTAQLSTSPFASPTSASPSHTVLAFPSFASASAAASSSGGGGGVGGAYVAPAYGADASHGIFAPQSRQQVARAAFGPSSLFAGQPIPTEILEQLWNFNQPEMFFVISECFRRTPRELALTIEHCEKLCGLAAAAVASGVNVNAAMLNVQSQLFLTVELLCHPVQEKRTERRFVHMFPCAHILLRCSALVRASTLDWRVPSSLTNALLVPQHFKRSSSSSTTVVNGKHLSPVIVLVSEMCRWHDMEPVREHAPWFAATASWAAVAVTIWTDLALHPVLLLPHVLTLKSLALAFPPSSSTSQQQQQQNSSPSSPAGGSPGTRSPGNLSFSNNNNATGGSGGGGGGSQRISPNSSMALADALTAVGDEEAREVTVLRNLLRRHLDAKQCVKTVVHSAVELAVLYHRRHRGMQLAVPSSSGAAQLRQKQTPAQVTETNKKNVELCFHVLAKMENLLKKVIWDNSHAHQIPSMDKNNSSSNNNNTVIADIPDSYIEKEVEMAFLQMGSGQVGINMLYEARGNIVDV